MAGIWTTLTWLLRERIASTLEWNATWLELGGNTPLSGLLIVYVLCFPVFWLSGKSFAAAWDAWVDTRKAWIRLRFSTEKKARLERLLEELAS